MHKKYQELPSQFIPKHTLKYQLKKTLINTKFQWLMKYIKHDNDNQTKLSKIINANQKQPLPFQRKSTQKQQNKILNPNPSPNPKQIQHPMPPQNGDRQVRPSLTTCKSTPDECIFIDKHKLRNRSMLSRNMKRTNKAASFFGEKENRGGGTAKMDRSKKMMTVVSLERSKTRNEIRARYQREPFVLSPWMFTEENIENKQFRF